MLEMGRRLFEEKENVKKKKHFISDAGLLKAPYSSKIDILLSKKGLINWYMVLIQS